MSSTYGVIKFKDNQILSFVYYGTSDIVIPGLHTDVKEIWDKNKESWDKLLDCNHTGEEVEAYAEYLGCSWITTACRECGVINGLLMTDDFEDELVRGKPDWVKEFCIKTWGKE
ncbi:hypothetical protein ACHHV8_11105 [Paenibacillus sp. TAB 01]|uniref:hypothetical protein n=1 Tax=Paenibacillus sp. TAB 01 TaxID=3368988 RepID=UPI0037503166